MVTSSGNSFIERCEEELRQVLFNMKRKKGTNATLSLDLITPQELQQIHTLIDRFANLTFSLPPELRVKAEERLNQYKNECQFLASNQLAYAIRKQPSIENPEETLLKADSQLASSSNRILEAQQLTAQSEEMGTNILNDLKRQREQLLKAQKSLHETDTNVGSSNRLMNEMYTRININRFLSYAVVGLLVLTLLLVLYYKLFR